MITNISIQNLAITDGRILNLNADSPDGYDVRQVEGLTPPPATIASTSNRFLPGTKITNIKSAPRTITITLEPNPYHSDSPFELRYGLYKHFVPGQRVLLRVDYSNKTSRQIEGVVETHEANVFSDEPRSQITIYCESPYFVDIEPTRVVCGTSLRPGRTMQAEIEVDGDVETPIELEFHTGSSIATSARITSVYVDLASPWMGSTSLRKFRLANMGSYGLRRNETFELSSIVGSKHVYRKSGNVRRSLLSFLSLTAEWPILTPGANRLEMQTTMRGTIQNLGYPILTYRTRYSGA